MRHPLLKDAPQVVRRQGNQQVQAFAPQRADESLAQGIGPGTLRRSFEHPQAKIAYVLVKLPGEDTITVMDQKSVGMISGNGFAQLLHGP